MKFESNTLEKILKNIYKNCVNLSMQIKFFCAKPIYLFVGHMIKV